MYSCHDPTQQMTMSYRNTNRRKEKSLSKGYEFNEDTQANGLSMPNGNFHYKSTREGDQFLKELYAKILTEYHYGVSILMLNCLARISITLEAWFKEPLIYCLRSRNSGCDEQNLKYSQAISRRLKTYLSNGLMLIPRKMSSSYIISILSKIVILNTKGPCLINGCLKCLVFIT